MRFSHSYGFEDNDSAAFDGGVLEYSTSGPGGPWIDAGSLFDSASGYNGEIAPGDNPLAGRSAFVRESNGYGASRLDLSSLAGEEARFRFRIGSDGLLDDYGWFIDDISIYTCEAAGPPGPPPALDTAPPNTRIGSGPARRTKKRRARFGFSSSEPGSSFRCALDKARFERCASPTRVRVKRGRHTFSVRAEDAAGNVDPSRAKYSWKVRRKGRRR
jgi:hypothetical protein